MSLIDSLNLAGLSLLSGGFGASVGLEAAYTQLGAGFASKAGRLLKLRRADLRMLVGCGAAAAIAAAFNAPLTGAFYAFELIVGSYTLDLLAPVTLAALAGTIAARVTFGADPVFGADQPITFNSRDYVLFALLGIASGGLAIVTMKLVTRVESWLRASRLPGWLRPAVGGIAVGGIAFVYPQVLGSGHGAIEFNLAAGFALPVTAGLVIAKIVASAISIGAGFRGGLFSSALFLGTLFGSAFAMTARGLFDEALRLARCGELEDVSDDVVGVGRSPLRVRCPLANLITGRPQSVRCAFADPGRIVRPDRVGWNVALRVVARAGAGHGAEQTGAEPGELAGGERHRLRR